MDHFGKIRDLCIALEKSNVKFDDGQSILIAGVDEKENKHFNMSKGDLFGLIHIICLIIDDYVKTQDLLTREDILNLVDGGCDFYGKEQI